MPGRRDGNRSALGDWDDRDGAGSLGFTGVDVPADGVYTLTFFHVHVNGEQRRTAVISVSNGVRIRMTVEGGSVCCTATRVQVTLEEGRNSITFSNDDGHAPAIDKIVLSRP